MSGSSPTPAKRLQSEELLSKFGAYLGAATALSLTLFTYERAVVPVYSSGPTNTLLNTVAGAAAALSAINPASPPPWSIWLLLGLAFAAAPNANYWVAVLTARNGDALRGAAITHIVVLAPLVFLVVSASKAYSEVSATRAKALLSRVSRSGGICFVAIQARQAWSSLPELYAISESQIYLGMSLVCFLACIGTAPFLQDTGKPVIDKKTKKVSTKKHQEEPQARRAIATVILVAVMGISYPVLKNPVLPHPLKEPYTSPDGTFRVLSAKQSVTGLISVVDWLPSIDKSGNNLMHSVRYLRAAHSLLGGVWTDEKVMVTDSDQSPLLDSYGKPLGDSIYSTFVIQEAVRMVSSTAKGHLDNALVIGLGIGTSATSLIRHGVSTTIVEIDPAVYDAARTYFGLPNPGDGHVFIEDARSWVETRKQAVASGEASPFDAVIHDCFSGGGVPEHIFTVEFWGTLKSIMSSEGVLVVNYAGIVNSDATRLVVNTLSKTFKQCRAFHDYFEEFTDEIWDNEFINVVFFCTNSKSPLTFRDGKDADYLGSPLRAHVLSSLSSRELDLAPLIDPQGGYVMTDSNNVLGELQNEQAAHHWEVMRTVLPNAQWETY